MRALTKMTLADTAVEAIRNEITARRWLVGEKLPNEASLSSMLSVSRGTIREAVRVLVSQGYLETRQGSGTYVRSNRDVSLPLDMARRAGLRDQFEARLALEVEAARLAALRHSPDVVSQLRALLVARGNYTGGDKAAFVERDLAFHRAVVAASQNRAMIEIYEFFSFSIAETIEATLGEDIPEPDMQAHIAIVDAIESGSPEAADRAVRHFMAPIVATLDRLLMS
ncbi:MULTISPECIES: FadR/GntR family transcriptional regulator [Rhizobium]|uniref:FadR family transcriptional regulator n=1 Tax=Rhizobium tropici TaxID=398 RepID=A0A6P1C0P9_RHITR|nr:MULTISPECIES: FadR/GntR family transcriptional regulator [Rhizobium]AGB74559.1 putative transcriptional regulator protein, GntR family [Rhizobium tropici CIAT 899]MBB4242703.1 DNA-binding FadR family transcriptional regulator [Rhizobium tropici]MBB5594392.1 DNA-binding FadR family transcriptional regulator [Rhizobium tropici]MBB6493028.1 DNA-binding FadR family transcriptional regulator [Rhizobium tropici]NEV10690.1 FadR family transcriptional regulator [Rhizobium tropici]